MTKAVSARQKLKSQLAAQFVKALKSDAGFRGLSGKSQRATAKSFVDLAARLTPDKSSKSLKKSFAAILGRVSDLQRKTGRVNTAFIMNVMDTLGSQPPMAPAGYKLVRLDPIEDSPAYGM